MFITKIQTTYYTRSKRGRKCRKKQRIFGSAAIPSIKHNITTPMNDNDIPPKATAA